MQLARSRSSSSAEAPPKPNIAARYCPRLTLKGCLQKDRSKSGNECGKSPGCTNDRSFIFSVARKATARRPPATASAATRIAVQQRHRPARVSLSVLTRTSRSAQKNSTTGAHPRPPPPAHHAARISAPPARPARSKTLHNPQSHAAPAGASASTTHAPRLASDTETNHHRTHTRRPGRQL